jgi:hypothetical protein
VYNLKDPMKVNTVPTKKLAIFFAAFGALMLAFSQNASACRHPLPPITLATSIDGMINIGGSVQFNGPFATATTVTNWINAHVEAGGTDDFAGIPLNTAVTMTPWTFSPSTFTPGLWSVAGFTFDLLTSTLVTHNNQFLTVTGTGTVKGPGFDDTAMEWSFSTQNLGGTMFSFSATGVAVPDGGATVALLGLTLVGVELLRRKLKAA